MQRLFVSVDLDGLADEIRAVQGRFEDASGLRLTDADQTHVTLKFLGDTDPERVDDLAAELAAAVADSGVEPFEAHIGGLGVFPSFDYISVVWLGVREGHGDGELRALHETIEDRTVAMGFDAEDHEFTPHATIARMDHAAGKHRVQDIVESEDPDVGRLRVEEIRLTESVLGADGPAYSTVDSVSL